MSLPNARRLLILVVACLILSIPTVTPSKAQTIQAEQLVPLVLKQIKHDPTTFTEGLELHNGVMYESGGLYGTSTLRVVDPETGIVSQKIPLDAKYFAEGITVVGQNLIQLTWKENTALVYDLATLK